MLSWDLIEICWIYIFFAVVEFVLGMMLFVDDGEKTQGSLKFQSRFTRPLKPFFHHSHGPQHAPSGSTRGVFLCSYFIQQGFLLLSKLYIDFVRDSLIQNLYLHVKCRLNPKLLNKELSKKSTITNQIYTIFHDSSLRL